MGLNQSLRNHHGKKKQLCIVPGLASFWNTGILRYELGISCKTTRRKKPLCHLIGVFIGRSHSLRLSRSHLGMFLWVTTTSQGSVTASCSPVGSGLLQALLWLGVGLEEGSHSQSWLCQAVTPLHQGFWANPPSGISPGACPCYEGVDQEGSSPFRSLIRFPSWALCKAPGVHLGSPGAAFLGERLLRQWFLGVTLHWGCRRWSRCPLGLRENCNTCCGLVSSVPLGPALWGESEADLACEGPRTISCGVRDHPCSQERPPPDFSPEKAQASHRPLQRKHGPFTFCFWFWCCIFSLELHPSWSVRQKCSMLDNPSGGVWEPGLLCAAPLRSSWLCSL